MGQKYVTFSMMHLVKMVNLWIGSKEVEIVDLRELFSNRLAELLDDMVAQGMDLPEIKEILEEGIDQVDEEIAQRGGK
jgi:hypothetical protein